MLQQASRKRKLDFVNLVKTMLKMDYFMWESNMNLLYEVEISSIEARSDRLENKVSTDTKANALKLLDALFMLNL